MKSQQLLMPKWKMEIKKKREIRKILQLPRSHQRLTQKCQTKRPNDFDPGYIINNSYRF